MNTWTVLAGITFLISQATAQTTPVRSLIRRYVEALQQRNYEEIVKLNWQFTMGEDLIRAEKPRFLWAELIAKYRTKEIQELKRNEADYLSASRCTQLTPRIEGGCPTWSGDTNDIHQQISLFPPGCKWTIAEVRAQIDGVGHRYSTIFLKVCGSVVSFDVMAPYNSSSTVLNFALVQ
jgi:hypothetical protein